MLVGSYILKRNFHSVSSYPFILNRKLLVLVLFVFFKNQRLLVLRPSPIFVSIGSSSLGTLWELDPTNVNLNTRERGRPKG